MEGEGSRPLGDTLGAAARCVGAAKAPLDGKGIRLDELRRAPPSRLIPPRLASGSVSAMIGFCRVVDDCSSRMQFLEVKYPLEQSAQQSRGGEGRHRHEPGTRRAR